MNRAAFFTTMTAAIAGGAFDPYTRGELVAGDDWFGDFDIDEENGAGAELVGGRDLVGQQLADLGLQRMGGAPGAAALAPFHPDVMRHIAQNAQADQIRAAVATYEHNQRQTQLSRARFLPAKAFGIGSQNGNATNTTAGLVNAGATSIITVTGSVDMRLTDLKIMAAIAGYFLINQISVAMVDYITGGPIPADTFIAQANRPPINIPRMNAGTPMTFTVSNIDANARLFVGQFDMLVLTPTDALAQ